MACFGHFVGSGAEAVDLGWHLPDEAAATDLHWCLRGAAAWVFAAT